MSENRHGWFSNPRHKGPLSFFPTPANLTSILMACPERPDEEEEYAADEMSDDEVGVSPRKSRKRFKRRERDAIANASCSKTIVSDAGIENLEEETTEALVVEDLTDVSKTVEDEEKPKETVAEEIEALRKIMKTVDVSKIPVEAIYLMETQYTRCLLQPGEVNPCMTTREFVNLVVKAKTADENKTLMDEEVNEEHNPEIINEDR